VSGGSWDYAYAKIEPIAEKLLEQNDPRRRALGNLLMQIKHALHDIEWVDSGDYGSGDDFAAITASLGGPQAAAQKALEMMVVTAEEHMKQLRELVSQAKRS